MAYFIPYHTFQGDCNSIDLPLIQNASMAFTEGNYICTVFCPCTMTNYKSYT